MERRKLKGCITGEAKLTRGYLLQAKYVIHTVGPIWRGGKSGEQQQLASCYNECFELAEQNNIRSIAFQSISTGIYGYPVEKAAPIALKEIATGLRTTSLSETIMVYFNKNTYNAYIAAYKNCP